MGAAEDVVVVFGGFAAAFALRITGSYAQLNGNSILKLLKV